MICQLRFPEKNIFSDPRVNLLLASPLPSSSRLISTVIEVWRYNTQWGHENESLRLKMTEQKTPGNLESLMTLLNRYTSTELSTSRLLAIEKNQFSCISQVGRFSVICN